MEANAKLHSDTAAPVLIFKSGFHLLVPPHTRAHLKLINELPDAVHLFKSLCTGIHMLSLKTGSKSAGHTIQPGWGSGVSATGSGHEWPIFTTLGGSCCCLSVFQEMTLPEDLWNFRDGGRHGRAVLLVCVSSLRGSPALQDVVASWLLSFLCFVKGVWGQGSSRARYFWKAEGGADFQGNSHWPVPSVSLSSKTFSVHLQVWCKVPTGSAFLVEVFKGDRVGVDLQLLLLFWVKHNRAGAATHPVERAAIFFIVAMETCLPSSFPCSQFPVYSGSKNVNGL